MNDKKHAPSLLYPTVFPKQKIQSQPNVYTSSSRRNKESDESSPLREDETAQYESCNDTKDTEPPSQAIAIHSWNSDVHSKQTGDEIQRDENGSDQSDFPKRLLDLITLGEVVHTDLSKVVGMAAAQHLLKVTQIAHHGDNVVLNIRQIHADVATGSDRVVLIAAFGEALDDIGLATK